MPLSGIRKFPFILLLTVATQVKLASVLLKLFGSIILMSDSNSQKTKKESENKSPNIFIKYL